MSNKLNKNDIKIERARRVKYVRELSKLAGIRTGEQFARHCGIARSTLTGWERGNATNCLTEKGAKKIVSGLQALDIRCTNLWLLYGIGSIPELVSLSKPSLGIQYPLVDEQLSGKICEPSLQENQTYAAEIAVFKTRYPENLVYQLQDDSMGPFYQAKDYVGGRIVPYSQLELMQAKICIVLFKSGKLLVRRIKLNKTQPYNIDFYVTNAEFSLDYPPLHQIPLQAISALAPIIRIWRDF